MAILNYTTTISEHITCADIQRMLSSKGARSISLEYDDKQRLTGISFSILVNGMMVHFKLPANWKGVQKALKNQTKAKKYHEDAHAIKDPRWQKKRLEVFERDSFSCQNCGDTLETLHVHHKSYIYGNDPWDYSITNFITLCETCHEEEENNKKLFQNRVACLLQVGLSYKDLYEHLFVLLPEDSSSFFKSINQKDA